MITTILKNASIWEIADARGWAADHLHVPVTSIPDDVAVAYVVRHFKQGYLTGWEGFRTLVADGG